MNASGVLIREALRRMKVNPCSIQKITELSDMVDILIERRRTTWEEIGLSENNFRWMLRKLLVKSVKLSFDRMVKGDPKNKTVAYLVDDVNRLIHSNQITWKELGFTEDSFKKEVKQARVRDARRSFKLVVRNTLPKNHLIKLASAVCALVESGKTSWGELGFTEEDLNEALEREATA